jgi:hypothetical protein
MLVCVTLPSRRYSSQSGKHGRPFTTGNAPASGRRRRRSSLGGRCGCRRSRAQSARRAPSRPPSAAAGRPPATIKASHQPRQHHPLAYVATCLSRAAQYPSQTGGKNTHKRQEGKDWLLRHSLGPLTWSPSLRSTVSAWASSRDPPRGLHAPHNTHTHTHATPQWPVSHHHPQTIPPFAERRLASVHPPRTNSMIPY